MDTQKNICPTLCDKIWKKSQSLLKIYILLHTAIKKKKWKKIRIIPYDVQKSDDGDAIDDSKDMRGRGIVMTWAFSFRNVLDCDDFYISCVILLPSIYIIFHPIVGMVWLVWSVVNIERNKVKAKNITDEQLFHDFSMEKFNFSHRFRNAE